MKKITDEILKAIDIIIDEKIKSLNFDKTHIGFVSKVLKDGYLVKYNGTEILIKESAKKYNKGDFVKFCIPCNNKRNAFLI